MNGRVNYEWMNHFLIAIDSVIFFKLSIKLSLFIKSNQSNSFRSIALMYRNKHSNLQFKCFIYEVYNELLLNSAFTNATRYIRK